MLLLANDIEALSTLALAATRLLRSGQTQLLAVAAIAEAALVLSAAPFVGSWLVASTELQWVLLLDGLSLGWRCCVCCGPGRHRWISGYPGRCRRTSSGGCGGCCTQPARLVALLGANMALVFAAREVLLRPGRSRLGWSA